MFTRIVAPVLLILFLLSCLSAPLQADDMESNEMKSMNKRMERMKIAMEVDPKPSAETVASLPVPPSSEAATLADLPEDAAGLLTTIYDWEEGDLLFLSTATMSEVQNFYADEMAKRGYSGSMMEDENGKPISPAFSYMCDLGVIRVMAADDAVPEKTLVAVIILVP